MTHVVADVAHVRHVELHVAQLLTVVGMRYWPGSHTNVHVLAAESKTPPSSQEEQPALVPSMHVLHEGSHALQVESAPSVYLPEGQVETQKPASEYFVSEAGHSAHADEPEPVHVLQDE